MGNLTTKQLARYAADRLEAGASSEELVNSIAQMLVAERRSRDVLAFGRLLEQELARRGTTQVVITSVSGVDKLIKERLAQMLGVKKALFHEVVDKSVIGGVRAQTLDSQIDLTIQGQLKAIKQAVNSEDK